MICRGWRLPRGAPCTMEGARHRGPSPVTKAWLPEGRAILNGICGCYLNASPGENLCVLEKVGELQVQSSAQYQRQRERGEGRWAAAMGKPGLEVSAQLCG